jgi:acid phosphatase class B
MKKLIAALSLVSAFAFADEPAKSVAMSASTGTPGIPTLQICQTVSHVNFTCGYVVDISSIHNMTFDQADTLMSNSGCGKNGGGKYYCPANSSWGFSGPSIWWIMNESNGSGYVGGVYIFLLN